MLSAKALYNNVPDTPEELSFSKGDVLEVLEKDENGWWLCTFKGKVGIAPGNRLQILSSITGSRSTSPSGRNSPSTSKALPAGQRLPAESKVSLSQKPSIGDPNVKPSWHINSKVVVPKKSGNFYVYDSPNRVYQDYDVPPARYEAQIGVANAGAVAQSNQNSLVGDSSAFQNYDVPSSLRSSVQAFPEPFDNYNKEASIMRPPSLSSDALPVKSSALLIYDIPPSCSTSAYEMDSTHDLNRLSVLSFLSTGSHSSACSGHSSLSEGLSTQSSMDVSLQDLYDVPPSVRLFSCPEVGNRLQALTAQNTPPNWRGACAKVSIKNCTQSSLTNSCVKKELVRQSSVGPPSSLKLIIDRDSYLEDYSVPRSDISQGSGDSGISVSNTDSFTTRSCSDEIYDTPRKLTESKTQCNSHIQELGDITYDVPSQMSQILDGINSSVERIGTDMSCMELSSSGSQMRNLANMLFALQSNVLGHGSKLVNLINNAMVEQEQEISHIKLTCLALKTALKEVIDFGNGLLAHSIHSTCKELSDNVFRLLDKVRIQFQYLNRHTEKLLSTQWSIKQPDQTPGEISELDDTLNTISMLTESISGHLLSFTRFVSQNTSLFVDKTAENPNSEPIISDKSRGLKEDAKFKLQLQASEDKTKVDRNLAEKQLQVQNRPLPPVPSQYLTNPDSRNSRCYSPSHGVPGMACVTPTNERFKEGDSSECNDECDYVSIANEAEKEMKTQEQVFEQQLLENVTLDCGEHQELGSDDSVLRQNVGVDLKVNSMSPVLVENIKGVQMSLVSTNVETTSECHSGGHSVPELEGKKCGNESVQPFSGSNHQMMTFYARQIDGHFSVIDTAVREFFHMIFSEHITVKEFLLRSKFVILAAHKLVYIGDTITRNSAQLLKQNEITQSANNLCDILKETVAATKTSALNFPQNVSQQKLINCMKAVLQASLQLCESIRNNAAKI